jgi:hypothetical protein
MNVPAVAVAVMAALLLSASPAIGAPAASSQPGEATAAAKKKPKKCRKGYVRKRVRGKARCVRKKKPAVTQPPAAVAPPAVPAPATTAPATPAAPAYTPPADPVAEFTRLMSGSHLYHLNQTTPSSTGASSRTEDKVSICSGGSWSRYREHTGVSGYVYQSQAQGTWKVEKAAFGKFQAADGSAVYRAEAQVAWSSSDPEDPAGPLIVNIVSASPDLTGATRLYIGEAEFQRTAGGAGC